jgi:hypothetical protein
MMFAGKEAPMKYEPLKRHLEGESRQDALRLDFAKIEDVLGFALPRSAYAHQAWWSNTRTGHSHAAAWLDAGWKTAELDLAGRKVSFFKTANEPFLAGVAEDGAAFRHREAEAITLPTDALSPRALSMIDHHVRQYGGDRASACLAILDQLAKDRLTAMFEWFQKASKPLDVDIAELIREDRKEREARYD